MRPVFIGGCSRSGTTLLAAMLGTHTQCLTTPEAKFTFLVYRACLQESSRVDTTTALKRIKAHWSFKIFDVDLDAAPAALEATGSYAELVKWVVRQYGARTGKAAPDIWVDHFPDNIIYAPTLFELFPDAKLIHLVRDGRAIAASIMGLSWGPNTIHKSAGLWINRLAHGLAAESFYGPQRVKQVRYENLLREPQQTVMEICDFMEIDYQPEMVSGAGFEVPGYSRNQHALVGRAPDVTRIEAWKQALSPRQIEVFESIAGSVLTSMGYDPVCGLSARVMTLQERWAGTASEFYRRQVEKRFGRRRRIQRALGDQLSPVSGKKANS